MNTQQCPRSTPWGHAQTIERIADGIWQVTTAGHGGVYVAPELRQSMPDYLSDATGYSGHGWFEEDCDWALACAAFPEQFDERSCYYALRQATNGGEYLKDRWAQYLSTPLADVLRKRAALYTPEAKDQMEAVEA